MITCPSCQSDNVASQSKGSRRFVDGEVDDNIELIYICLSCFEEVPPPDFDEHEPELDYKKLHSTDDLPF